MKKTTQLRELLTRKNKIVNAAMVACALDARIAELAGFEAAHISGGFTAAMIHGLPDAGLVTATEMIDNARRIASCVSIPVLADADQGFGGAINTRRTIQEFIRAGIAGVHIEDQPFPKRCGSARGKEVISLEEAVGKLRAAVDAKNELDPDFVIIARCDARGVVGGTVADVIQRLKAYKAAGADVVFPERLVSRDELREVRACVDGPMFSIAGSLNPPPTPEEWQTLGFCLWPEFGPLRAGVQAYWEFAKDLQARGGLAREAWQKRRWEYPVRHILDLTGFQEIVEAEQKYLPEEWLKKYDDSPEKT